MTVRVVKTLRGNSNDPKVEQLMEVWYETIVSGLMINDVNNICRYSSNPYL